MKFLDKWNKAKFNAYDSEEKTVLKLISKLGDFIGDLAKGVDSKTDNDGDHKGSWQGLNRPTLSEEGMRSTVEKHIDDIAEINNNLQIIDDKTQNLINGLHKVNYKAISLTIDTHKENGILEKQINKIKNVSNEVVICPLVNVSTPNSADFQAFDLTKYNSYMDKIQASGLKIIMIKPHIVINWSDGFNRSEYEPASIIDFFNNWKNILMTYAESCIKYNVPFLCLTCEMDKITIAENNTHWKSLITELKNTFPNLILTCSLNAAEIWNSVQYYIPQERENFLNYVDVIGVNLYPKILDKVYTPLTPNITLDECIDGWVRSVENDEPIYRTHLLSSYYKKKIFITEVGIMPRVDGIKQLIATGDITFKTQALYYEAFFITVCNNDNVIGFSIWNCQEPFNFNDDSGILTESEVILKKYIGGVL